MKLAVYSGRRTGTVDGTRAAPSERSPMDIIVKGRGIEVPERLRLHIEEKLSKLEKHDRRVQRIEVAVVKEHNPRLADQGERIELTLYSKGPVVRAEAAAQDAYAALDLATDKLAARVRKAADRRRVHHGTRTPISVAAATAGLPSPDGDTAVAAVPEVDPYEPATLDDGPLVVREKTHQAKPMTVDQALEEMELVGHDFYLYVDATTSQPSVVYRRRGYDYGVIHLDML
jgi:ribosomal subunit interface protein